MTSGRLSIEEFGKSLLGIINCENGDRIELTGTSRNHIRRREEDFCPRNDIVLTEKQPMSGLAFLLWGAEMRKRRLMTDIEAYIEAKKRFGESAFAVAYEFKRIRMVKQCRVGVRVKIGSQENLYCLGLAGTWETAFKRAERKILK